MKKNKDRKKYPKLKLIPDKIAGHRCVWFRYMLSCDVGFKFSILSECRDDIAGVFKVTMYEKDLGYEEIEVDCKPWVITRVWRKTLTPSQEVVLRLLLKNGAWNPVSNTWVCKCNSHTERIMRALVSKKYAESSEVGNLCTYRITALGKKYLGDKDAKS